MVKSGHNLHLFGPLAQLAEQLTLNQRVEGSSPPWVTTALTYVGAFCLGAECLGSPKGDDIQHRARQGSPPWVTRKTDH
jgi:hypothetical protein